MEAQGAWYVLNVSLPTFLMCFHRQIEGPPPEEPPPPAIEDAPPVQARPGWRVVHKRPERRERPLKIQAAPSPAPAPAPAPEPPRPDLPAWSQWRRMSSYRTPVLVVLCSYPSPANPLLAPAPVPAAAMSRSPPPRSGLFGELRSSLFPESEV